MNKTRHFPLLQHIYAFNTKIYLQEGLHHLVYSFISDLNEHTLYLCSATCLLIYNVLWFFCARDIIIYLIARYSSGSYINTFGVLRNILKKIFSGNIQEICRIIIIWNFWSVFVILVLCTTFWLVFYYIQLFVVVCHCPL